MNEQTKSYIVNQSDLPAQYPTHKHNPLFWESLGRTVATFGLLEETLGKAIFAFTSTKRHGEDEFERAYFQWLSTLEIALADPLGSLISTYDKTVRDHPNSLTDHHATLIADLRESSKIRNVLCHGSWSRLPDKNGASVPFYVAKKQMEIFDTPVDIKFLNQLQKHAVDLICAVVNSVTLLGWQFPGSKGPGKVI